MKDHDDDLAHFGINEDDAVRRLQSHTANEIARARKSMEPNQHPRIDWAPECGNCEHWNCACITLLTSALDSGASIKQ